MLYSKLKRTWTNGYANNIPNFKKTFPELSHINSEELCDRLIELDIDFYHEEKVPVNFWTRLTLPIALIVILFMFIGLPINFIIKGE